jgi:putative transposase
MSAACVARQGFADQSPERGISSATFYKYKSKYGGMEPSSSKRLLAPEDENGTLKKLLAEQMSDNAMLRDINSKSGDALRKAESCGSIDGYLSGEPTSAAPQWIMARSSRAWLSLCGCKKRALIGITSHPESRSRTGSSKTSTEN